MDKAVLGATATEQGAAFGSALAGGAIAGSMGAFMAMPVAALATSFVKNYVPRYPLVYRSAYDPHETDTPVPAAGPAAEIPMQEELR